MIKTNELQQIAAPQGADSILLDTAAAGTGRLTLAKAAEFFGAELVKPANPVGAALSNKAAKSVQETVEATSVPDRIVTVAAAELPAYIAGLPRLLTENLTITVIGGTGAVTLYIVGFYGPGSLIIQVADGAEVVFEIFKIINCSIFIHLKNIKVQNTSDTVTAFGADSSIVRAEDCSVSRAKSGDASGFTVTHGGAVSLFRCDFQSCTSALNVQTSSILSVIDCIGSNNNTGCVVLMGGTILLGGTTPDLMGGSANIKGGGIIAKANGTLL